MAVLRTEPHGVLGRSAAASIHGLDGFTTSSSPVWTLIPVKHRVRAPGVVRTRRPPQAVTVQELPVTSVGRTLADLGYGLKAASRWAGDEEPIAPLDRIELALESALRRKQATVDDLLARTSGTDCGAGPRMLAEVLERRPAGAPPTESYLETRCVQMLRAHGLPVPRRQQTITDHRHRFIGRVDLQIDHVIIECDGRESHDRSEAFAKDRERWSRLQAEGYSPIVLVSEQIEREPATTSELIRRTLDRTAGASPVSKPRLPGGAARPTARL